MGNSIPPIDQYEGDADFEDVRVGMRDRSTYVFGRVSAAIRFARQNEADVLDFTIGTAEPYQPWTGGKKAAQPSAPRKRRHGSDTLPARARRPKA